MWNILILCHFLLICILGLSSSKIPPVNAAVTAITGMDLEDVCLEGVTQRQFDVLAVLILICIQVSRRLYECCFVSVFSGSKMHLLHLLLGLYFYTSLGPTALLHLDLGEDIFQLQGTFLGCVEEDATTFTCSVISNS